MSVMVLTGLKPRQSELLGVDLLKNGRLSGLSLARSRW